MTSHAHFTVLSPLEFLKNVTKESQAAKRRFYAQAMEVEPEGHTHELLNALKTAALRGVDTRLHADWYSLLVVDGTFNSWPFVSAEFRRKRRIRLAKKRAMNVDLPNAGVRFLFTNPPTLLDRLFPARGRNHMKMVIIDDISYLGGVNFHTENFQASDLMIKITDPKITEEIAYIFATIDNGDELRDMAITCTDETILLVDGGRINRSIILRYAVELVNQSKESVEVITPLIPDAAFLTALTEAKRRGRKVDVVSPEINRMVGVYTLVDWYNQLLMQIKGRTLPIDFKRHMIHAKVLIVDQKEIIVGSHNFSSRGVRMGTEEIALRSTNKSLVTELVSYYTKLKNETK